MTKYLLDTDICIFFLKKQFHLDEKIEAVGPANCFVSELSIAELIFGAHNSGNYEKHKDDHVKVLSVTTLKRVLPSFDAYGKEKARLRKAGHSIPELDLLIATTALHHNMTLVTNNTKHMQRIDGIKLENWTKAEDNTFIK